MHTCSICFATLRHETGIVSPSLRSLRVETSSGCDISESILRKCFGIFTTGCVSLFDSLAFPLFAGILSKDFGSSFRSSKVLSFISEANRLDGSLSANQE